MVTRQQAYEGHAWLVGSAWGFGAETAVHALRLMGSGLFDEYPKLRIILGHLGEGVPFSIWRVDYRVSTMANANLRPKTKLPMSEYLRENFYITTSGNFRTQALIDVMMEVGADRVLYSVVYPFEDMGEAANWFDRNCSTSRHTSQLEKSGLCIKSFGGIVSNTGTKVLVLEMLQ